VDELSELANSDSTHGRLIELRCEVPQTHFIQRREPVKAPNRKGELPMKSKKTLVLAASILALTLSTFSHDAAASSTDTPPSDSQALRKAGGSNLIYLQIALAAGTLISALLP
jgi:hypothetical protein